MQMQIRWSRVKRSCDSNERIPARSSALEVDRLRHGVKTQKHRTEAQRRYFQENYEVDGRTSVTQHDLAYVVCLLPRIGFN